MAEEDAPLAGTVFVFTGELSIPREEARSRVTLLGARVTTAISSKTTHLVAGADPGVSKLEKARSSGIKVLNEEEFTKLLALNERKVRREIVDVPCPASSLLSESLPWAEKYRPKTTKEFIGNKPILARLEEFLTGNTEYKAALLSGPPGIGKTTAAHLVADSCGYEVIEFNASDVRNKSSIAQKIAPIAESPLGLATTGRRKRRVIVMDEVDGMTSDRGGVPELVKVIKKTRVPIICICNDRNHLKMRTLASMSLDLRFRKPDNRAILTRAKEILKYESGQSLSENVINEIISRSNGDIRFVMSGLQSAAGARIPLGTFSKTADRTLFDFASEIFRKASIETKLSVFFEEYDMLPLFVHENYPKLDQRSLRDLFRSAESISFADVIDSQIHSKEQNWSLLPLFGFFSCVLPVRNTRLASRLDFPSFLGQNSKRLKMQRYVSSVGKRCKVKMTPEDMRLYALPLIAPQLLDALRSDPQSAAAAVSELGLRREDLAEILESFCPTEYKSVPAKNKRAFTAAYNKMRPVLPNETGRESISPSSSDNDETVEDME